MKSQGKPEIRDNHRIKDLTEAVKTLADEASWVKNIGIENKKEERERFKESRKAGKQFKPDFKFKQGQNQHKLLDKIQVYKEQAERITEEDITKYNPEEITSNDLEKFFKDIFEELELYVKLASNIENEQSWRKYSEKIWPMIDQDKYEESLNALEDLEADTSNLDKKLDAEDLKEMFEKEISNLDMEYSVEIRDVGGCFNIPEEKTVVVANGSGKDTRLYSQEEAEMLTKHEIFHSIRAYNGYKAGEQSGFPPILGIHTPFYDQTEEGGALYREQETKTNYVQKDFDYHLRLIAAYEIAKSDNYQEEFHDIVEKLIELGGSVDRSFYLVARNREALRHHIYLSGVDDWKNKDSLWPLMIGKISSQYADVFRKEVEANGMLKKPEIMPDQVFETSF